MKRSTLEYFQWQAKEVRKTRSVCRRRRPSPARHRRAPVRVQCSPQVPSVLTAWRLCVVESAADPRLALMWQPVRFAGASSWPSGSDAVSRCGSLGEHVRDIPGRWGGISVVRSRPTHPDPGVPGATNPGSRWSLALDHHSVLVAEPPLDQLEHQEQAFRPRWAGGPGGLGFRIRFWSWIRMLCEGPLNKKASFATADCTIKESAKVLPRKHKPNWQVTTLQSSKISISWKSPLQMII